MSPVPRAIVEAFYHALSIRDMAALANFLHDEVVWTISGPVDILPFCGQRVGKALVMKLLGRDSPTLLSGSPVCRQDDAGGRRSCGSPRQAHGDKACERPSDQLSHRPFHPVPRREVVDYVSIIDASTPSNSYSATASMRMTVIASKATSLRCSGRQSAATSSVRSQRPRPSCPENPQRCRYSSLKLELPETGRALPRRGSNSLRQ